MNRKKLAIMSIVAAVFSLILYFTLFIMSLGLVEFELAMVLLYSAQALLVIAVGFAIFAVMLKYKPKKDQQISKCICAFVINLAVIFVVFLGYGYMTFYDCFEPFDSEIYDIPRENEEYAKQLFPYVDSNELNRNNSSVEYSRFPGTNHIKVYSHGLSDSGLMLAYSAEYFNSSSPFMTLKFRLLKNISNRSHFDSNSQNLSVNGESVLLHKSDDCIIAQVKHFSSTFYVQLKFTSDNSVNVDDFVKIVIEQYNLIKMSEDNGFKEFSL